MKYERDIITAAVVNFHPVYGDKQANLLRIIEFSAAAAKRGADLILFPEMSLMGYDFFTNPAETQKDKLSASEPISGPSVSLLAETAKKYGIYIVFGMSERPEADADILYNSAVAIGPGGTMGVYRKIHPFHRENNWCRKGDCPFLFPTPWGPIAIGICYDSYYFPELLRYYVYKGARLYLNPTSVDQSVSGEGGREAFVQDYKPHLEYGVRVNSIFIASANLTGYDGRSFYAGGSMILGPKVNPFHSIGVTTYCGSENDYQVGMHLATLDLTMSTRRIFEDNPLTGEPDFRPEIYKNFY